MTETTYAQAYTEVLEILKNLPEVEYNKIPKEKIEFYKENCDLSYHFVLDKDLKNISKRANAIIVSIYNDYFTTPKQKETLHNILADNERKAEELRKEKYNSDDIFKNNKVENVKDELTNENNQMIEIKEENIFTKIMNKIKMFFTKLKKQ
jgi:Glu-tRNA(Gln) amidotransferase subunit E-like FAD-binding protein